MQILGIDAMGGDLGSHVVFKGLKKVLKQHPTIHFNIYLTAAEKHTAEQILKPHHQQISLIECEQSIHMTDKAIKLLHDKQNSTLACALQALKKQQIAGVFSMANTGAMVVLAKQILGLFPNLKRPALAAQLPTANKPLWALDLGANTQTSVQQLCEFAYLGVAWQRICGIKNPQLALLNIASEPDKGPPQIKKAAKQLQQSIKNLFAGYCEADQLWQGYYDILISDGFSGNIALKSAEGMQRLLKTKSQNKNQYNTEELNTHAAALLLGVQGLVVKSHGASNEQNISIALDYFVKQAAGFNVKIFIHEYICLQKNQDSLT